MIVAVPAEEQKLDSPLCVSFGRAPYYCIFDTENQKSNFIVNEAAQSPGEPASKQPRFGGCENHHADHLSLGRKCCKSAESRRHIPA